MYLLFEAWKLSSQKSFDSNGREYKSLHDWLVGNHEESVDKTPWQKGDNINDDSSFWWKDKI